MVEEIVTVACNSTGPVCTAKAIHCLLITVSFFKRPDCKRGLFLVLYGIIARIGPVVTEPGPAAHLCVRTRTLVKGELNPEMKHSQSIELFVTKRLPPIRSLSDVWFSSCAS